jgi:hypothetical protein
MYCSGCGFVLPPGQGFCPQCGRPAAPPIPPVPGLEFELQNYAGKVKALAVVWYIFAGYSLLRALIWMGFANAFLSGPFGDWAREHWMHGGYPSNSFAMAIMQFGWLLISAEAVLALCTAWGLTKRASWGRIVAIVAAILSLIKFPFGTALGIWTLVVLLGYRNSTLYEQL